MSTRFMDSGGVLGYGRCKRYPAVAWKAPRVFTSCIHLRLGMNSENDRAFNHMKLVPLLAYQLRVTRQGFAPPIWPKHLSYTDLPPLKDAA